MASIPLPALTVRPPEQPDPMQQYGRYMALKNALQQGQVNQLALRQKQTEFNEGEAVKQAIANAGGDVRKALPEIIKASPRTGIVMQRQLAEWDAADVNQKKNILDLQQARIKRLSQLAAGVTSQEQYTAGLQQAVKEGLLDQESAQTYAQQTWTPELTQRFQTEALDTSQRLQNARQQLELEAKLPGIKADTERKMAEAEATKKYGATDQKIVDAQYRMLQMKKQRGEATADELGWLRAEERRRQLTGLTRIESGEGKALVPHTAVINGRLMLWNPKTERFDTELGAPGGSVERAERTKQNEINKLRGRWKWDKAAGEFRDLQGDAMSAEDFHDAEQDIQDAWESELAAAGVNVPHQDVRTDWHGAARAPQPAPPSAATGVPAGTVEQPKPAKPAAAKPQKGERRYYQGRPYEFDGAKWVLVSAQ